MTPPDAELNVDGTTHPLVEGAYTHKQQEGQPLKLEAKRAGFVTVSRSITPAELAKLGNKVSLELEREKPKLPESLVAKPGAEVDSDTQLPVRAMAARLGDREPLEFALVKPGTYTYGSAEKTARGRSCRSAPSRSSSRSTSRSTKSPTPSTKNSPLPRATRRRAPAGRTRRKSGPRRSISTRSKILCR